MLARHDLVWLSPAGWEHAAALAHAGEREAITDWGRAGWPAVATRPPHELRPGHVALGLALPPRARDGAKPRIAIQAATSAIADTRPAIELAPVLRTVPREWRQPLAALLDDAGEAGVELRVYGSVAFQALTGQRYLSATSDIDLLLQPGTHAQYHSALALLARHARALPLDGEIVFPDGRAVAWKELLRVSDPQARVLAKSMHAVALVGVGSLLASLDTEPCTT
jgi:phosphoribosyl-dephospho-CoA transferase